MDDFGIESAAFLNVAKLRPGQIIIAPKLIEHLGQEAQELNSTALLTAAIGGAKALDCSVTVKDVTRQQQADLLINMGVRHGTGPLWIDALCPNDMRRHLTEAPDQEVKQAANG